MGDCDLAAHAAGDVFVVFSRLRRRVKALAVEGDLTPAQASVLARLDKEGPASASDLAVAERVRPQSMAKIVMTMELAGLVERNPDPTDGRRQLVTLTEQGRERRIGDRLAREQWLARTLREHCTDDQLRAVIEVMGLLDDVTHA
ncbi:DNA-binding transcriptional regulator, MarR family [Nonomuraea maritima]|uniref:DNA-binding transcriptional regulator, MarR family n=1 Tax=Nonomuraea maritima TaxID=683260 RepID=A0A1G9JTC2_9ACTN|nr:MarR family transcriptional regulator [Nonomuraea maritima]SDL40711.1 DNA-binding transcriptional regulator, MarR family [Nonomuraea maritima]